MPAVADLAAFVHRHPRLFVLTGAGCSTDCGIPDYRDDSGNWKRQPPVSFQAFRADIATRRRYWARSLVGWRAIVRAQPGPAHRALAALEAAERVELLVTQNVDGLHRAAGSRALVDLHGCLDGVRCLDCGEHIARTAMQAMLRERNPSWDALDAEAAPDGDADVDAGFTGFDVPDCPSCTGMLKPDVVFFGESVPRDRVSAAFAALDRADAVLVAGSSLMVYSGFRFVQAAAAAGKPVAAVNLGRTRADALFALKVAAPAGSVLAGLAAALPAEAAIAIP